MTDTVFFEQGSSPLLISIPHDGRDLAPGMEERMSEAGRSLPDTDWNVRRLYDFASQLGVSVLAARFSRYVVDLNRPASDAALYDGQLSTGLCPSMTFAGDELYTRGRACDSLEQQERIRTYWQPYHDLLDSELTRIRQQFGYALLWDAHSIRSEVPGLFDGTLPDMSLGTNDGASCELRWQRAVYEVAEKSGYSAVVNGRFKGGYITRNYGSPENDVHSIQLELAQRLYMDEKCLHYNEGAAGSLRDVIRDMLTAFIASAGRK
jgi:N-formylglutamate amidohydrolase